MIGRQRCANTVHFRWFTSTGCLAALGTPQRDGAQDSEQLLQKRRKSRGSCRCRRNKSSALLSAKRSKMVRPFCSMPVPLAQRRATCWAASRTAPMRPCKPKQYIQEREFRQRRMFKGRHAGRVCLIPPVRRLDDARQDSFVRPVMDLSTQELGHQDAKYKIFIKWRFDAPKP